MIDGDSLTVEDTKDGTEYEVRLHGIDAPENGQPHCLQATRELAGLTDDAVFLMEILQQHDYYRRVVGILHLEDLSTTVNHQMVESGWAFAYTHFGTLPGILVSERKAKDNGIGVWQDGDDMIRPWEWRWGLRSLPDGPPVRSHTDVPPPPLRNIPRHLDDPVYSGEPLSYEDWLARPPVTSRFRSYRSGRRRRRTYTESNRVRNPTSFQRSRHKNKMPDWMGGLVLTFLILVVSVLCGVLYDRGS